MALSFTLEWRTKWRERIHKMEIFAHAVAGSPGEPNVGNEIKVSFPVVQYGMRIQDRLLADAGV